jgi:hypothetical protein
LFYTLISSVFACFLRYNPDAMATPEQQPVIDLARRTLASRQCAELLRRVLFSQSMLTSALEVFSTSGAIKEQILSEVPAGKSSLRALLQEIAAPETADPGIDFDKLTDTLSAQTAVNAENVIAAAVVVLSHATANDIFTAACESAIELDPASWFSELSMERKVPLGLLRDKGPAGVFALELDKLRQQLSERSLPNRAELFFRHVKIRHHPTFAPPDVQYFRQSRMVEAEHLRNNILRESGLPQIDLDLGRQIMVFLHEAALTALRSLASAYRLPVEWNILLGSHKEDVG